MISKELLEKVQDRVANNSVGPSTVHGQKTGTVKAARTFFKKLNLNVFSNVSNEADFLEKLDKQTKLLQPKLPDRKWGFARKTLNIFLFQAAHDIYLSKKYGLRKLVKFLELPLDNPNAERLKEENENGKKLNWENIKDLEKKDSDEFQSVAKEIARNKKYGYNCKRCELEFYFYKQKKRNKFRIVLDST